MLRILFFPPWNGISSVVMCLLTSYLYIPILYSTFKLLIFVGKKVERET